MINPLHITRQREPFYDVALKYIPENPDAAILEIGPGIGTFLDHGKLVQKYKNLYVIENSEASARLLSQKGVPHIFKQDIAAGIPLPDHSLDFIHCSHLIEHLDYQSLYFLMKEFNRVLKVNGILVISAPLMHSRFYADLSHIKPYNPNIFEDYMCNGDKTNRVRDLISSDFKTQEIVYRYSKAIQQPFYYSEIPLVNMVMGLLKWILKKLKTELYQKSAYTIVLKRLSI